MSHGVQPEAVVVVGLILVSHILSLRSAWKALRRRKTPATRDFANMGLILFYDVGLVMEISGLPYVSPWFDSLLEADDVTLLLGTGILMAAPWLLKGGASLVKPSAGYDQYALRHLLGRKQRFWFAVLSIAVSVVLGTYGLKRLIEAGTIWSARRELGPEWGTLIVVFYLPIHFLAFYVRRIGVHSPGRLIGALVLAAMAILSTLPVGQRTNVLLPVLIILLFGLRPTRYRVLLAVAILTLSAAILLPSFKWQHAQGSDTFASLLVRTLHGDLARAPVLRSAIAAAESVGTTIVPYPMAGYVYSLLFFVPRSIAPFKGESTAKLFTSYIVGTAVDETNWGFGLGLLEELIVNAGILAVIPGLIIWGAIMGAIDKASMRIDALVVPARLGAVWAMGYHLPAVLLTFGVMAILGVGLSAVFTGEAHRGPRSSADEMTAAELQKGGDRGWEWPGPMNDGSGARSQGG